MTSDGLPPFACRNCHSRFGVGYVPPLTVDGHLQASSAVSTPRHTSLSLEIPQFFGNFRAQSAPPGLPSDRRFRPAPASSTPVDESPFPTSSLLFFEDTSVSFAPNFTQQRLVEVQPQHIPRPPNAFLLYRSDFLKRRTIPREVEKRQQNLSRIIGECWNMLSAEEKAIWHEKAAAVTAAHQAKYPHYKFRPTRRTAGKRTGKNKRNGNISQHHDSSAAETFSNSIESSIGPVRGPPTTGSSARMFPYDDGRLTTPKGPTIPSTPASLALSPLSLATVLPPFTLQDQLTSVSPFCGNAPQMQTYEGQSATLFNPENMLSELVQGLNIVPTTDHNSGILGDTQPPSAYFRLKQHHVPHTLGQDYTPLPLLRSTASPLLPFGENADPFLSAWNTPVTFNCPGDGLDPYHATLLSWLPEGSTSAEQENICQGQGNQQL